MGAGGGLRDIWSGYQSLVPAQEAAGVLAASPAPPPCSHPLPDTPHTPAKRHKGISRAHIWEELPNSFAICYLSLFFFFLKILSQTSWEAHDFMILRASGPQIQRSEDSRGWRSLFSVWAQGPQPGGQQSPPRPQATCLLPTLRPHDLSCELRDGPRA